MPAFQYSGYQNPYASTIADILQRQGDIRARQALTVGEAQARAVEQSGNAWGQAISGIGQSIGAIPLQIQQAKTQQLQSNLLKLKVDEAQRDVAGRRAVASMMQGDQLAPEATGPRQSSYLDTSGLFDIGKITQALGQSGYGDIAPDLVKGAEAINTSILNHQKAEQETAQAHAVLLGDLANGALKLTKTGTPLLAAMDFVVQPALATKRIKQNEYVTVRNQIAAMPPEQQQAALTTLMDQAAQLGGTKTLAEGATDVDRYGRVITTGQTKPPTEASLAVGAAGGDTQAAAALGLLKTPPSLQSENVLLDGTSAKVTFNPKTGTYHDASGADVTARVKPIPSQAAVNIQQGATDASSIADAIEQGLQPPDVKGLYRLAGPVRAELAKRGFDLTKANLDWQATQKHVATMNGAKFTALRSSIDTASDSLDVIQQLADQWNGGRFPLLNKANLALAKNGAYGKDIASIATQLDGQITDVTSELGQVYMGGNSPTDHALGLAEKNLKGEWDRKVLTDMIALARTNLKIRKNSITHSTPAGLSTSPSSTPKGDPLGLFGPKK